MELYRRHLPHIVPEGAPIFLTWCLKGAIPHDVAERLRQQRDQLRREPKRPGESPPQRRRRLQVQAFARMDAYLDRTADGPKYLRGAACAKIVEDAILFGARERYELYAWCVMANHVHLLATPLRPLARVTQGIKGYTARLVNFQLNRTGRHLWQDESYDHWVRDPDELLRIVQYIESNPVAAGLCDAPEDWPWSSARFRSQWDRGTPMGAELLLAARSRASG